MLWFPFVQTVLDAGLSTVRSQSSVGLASLISAVHALSASNVLLGLLATLLILAGMTAAIYSLAVRDGLRASRRLADAIPDIATDGLAGSVSTAIRTPLQKIVAELNVVVSRLRALLTGDNPDVAE